VDDLTVTNLNVSDLALDTLRVSDITSSARLVVESGTIENLIVSSEFDALIGTVDSLGVDDLTATNVIATNIQADVASAGTLNVESVEISDLIVSSEFDALIGTVDSLGVDDLTVTNLNVSDLVLDTLRVSDITSLSKLIVDSATIDVLNVNCGNFDNLTVADRLEGLGYYLSAGSVDTMLVDALTFNTVVGTEFQTYTQSAELLHVDSATIDNLNTTNLTVADVSFETLTVSDARIGVFSFGVLDGTSGHIENLIAETLSASDFIAGIASADILNVQSGDIESLISSNFIAGTVSADITRIQSGYIESLISSNFICGIGSAEMFYAPLLLVASEMAVSNVACINNLNARELSVVEGNFFVNSGIVSTSNAIITAVFSHHDWRFFYPNQNTGIVLNYLNLGNRSRFNIENLANATTNNREIKLKFHASPSTLMRGTYGGAVYFPAAFGDTVTGGTTLYMRSTGQIGTSTSLKESKTNIEPLTTNSLTWVDSVEWIQFNYRRFDKDGKTYIDSFYTLLEYGTIAEEIESVNSNFVFYKDEQIGTESGTDIPIIEPRLCGVRYEKFVPLAMFQIQELKKEIQNLKSHITSLEAKK